MKRRGNTAAVSAPMEPPPVVVAYPTTPTPTQPSTTSKEARSSDTGTKVFPVCNYAEMKEQSTSVEELRKLCFPASFSLYEAQLELVPPGVTSASFASQSTCTVTKLDMYNSKDSSMDTCMLGELMRKSEKYSASLTKQTKAMDFRRKEIRQTHSTCHGMYPNPQGRKDLVDQCREEKRVDPAQRRVGDGRRIGRVRNP